jgi:lipoyl(octanoyl) transferase
MNPIQFEDWGLTEYKVAYEKQLDLFARNTERKIGGFRTTNHLIFCEHPHVYTLGKNGNESNLLVNEQFLKSVGASFHKTDRGGDITYHGPGQLTGYLIFDLDNLKIGIKDFVWRIEEKIISVLKDYGIDGYHSESASGVWLDISMPSERKICAIGIRSGHGITMHGFALNVNTDLNYFKHINPCGFIQKGVSSMKLETGFEIDFERLKSKVKEEMLFFLD